MIEDEKLIRQNLRFILSKNNYVCEVAEDGIDGVLKIETMQPDLVLCDIMLPGLNGFDVLKKIRSNSKCINLPFIFLTARADEKDKRLGMNLGADDYLVKPFSTKELLETIERRLYFAGTKLEKQQADTLTSAYNIFYTVSSHEYLTPLNSVINFSSILLGETEAVLTPQQHQLLEKIYFSGKKLYRVTRKLFWFIKYKENNERAWQLHGKSKIALQAFFKKEENVFLSGVNRCPVEFYGEDLTLENYNYPDTELMVGELIENAAKFSNPQSVITITLSKVEQQIYIAVKNDYAGAAFTNQDIFPLAPKAAEDKWKGPGLGLYLLLVWCNTLGGSLKVTGENGVFTALLVLPQSL